MPFVLVVIAGIIATVAGCIMLNKLTRHDGLHQTTTGHSKHITDRDGAYFKTRVQAEALCASNVERLISSNGDVTYFCPIDSVQLSHRRLRVDKDFATAAEAERICAKNYLVIITPGDPRPYICPLIFKLRQCPSATLCEANAKA